MSNRYLCLIIICVITNLLHSQTTQWKISWNLNTEDDMSHYIIFRGTNTAPTNSVGTVNHPQNEYTDTPPQKGTLYYYRLKAVDFSGNESEYSVAASAAIPSIDFSNLAAQVIGPGESLTIPNLNTYVTDADDNSFLWSAEGPSLTITIDNATQTATVYAHSDFNNAVMAEFRAEDSDGFFDLGTIYFKADSNIIIPDNGEPVFAYPVPLDLAKNPEAKITFMNIPDNATVYIYNLLGELVCELKNQPFEWDIKNEARKAVHPGVYLYYIRSGSKKRTGKLVIVK